MMRGMLIAIENETLLLWGGSLLVTLLLGWLIGYSRAQREITELREERTRLDTLLQAERESLSERMRSLDDLRDQFEYMFKSLAGDALRSNTSEFMKLAETRFNTLQTKASSELEQREKAVENLVRPIRETLEKTDLQIREMEKQRQETFGSLSQHLQLMAQSQELLRGETRNLVKALRRPEVRGQWGELTLKRLAELAGMVEHCDFETQQSIETEQGRQRPDLVVRLPGGRQIVVDAKSPMDGYLGAVEATDDELRASELQRHARNMRDRVRELASKAYWKNHSESLDFVVLFVPGDQFLSAALEVDPKLLEDALSNKVVLATPSSLVALLRAIAYGWRQESLAKNAAQIRTIGEELYERLASFAGHLEKLGGSLTRSVDSYNKAVGAFDSRVLPSVRKFEELGIQAKTEIPEAQQVERLPRSVQSGSDSAGGNE